MSNVIPISRALRARIRQRRPSRIAEPRPVEFGDLELPTLFAQSHPELPVWHFCKHPGCNEIVPQRGYCIGCRARISAMRIVRGPYRRDVP